MTAAKVPATAELMAAPLPPPLFSKDKTHKTGCTNRLEAIAAPSMEQNYKHPPTYEVKLRYATICNVQVSSPWPEIKGALLHNSNTHVSICFLMYLCTYIFAVEANVKGTWNRRQHLVSDCPQGRSCA